MNEVTNAQILRVSSFALPLMTELQDREPGYQPIHAERLFEQNMIAALACMSSPASCRVPRRWLELSTLDEHGTFFRPGPRSVSFLLDQCIRVMLC